jgi:hypothetical protein
VSTTQVKEHPIIMRAHNVRAILSGVKTQTRRVIKPQPTHQLIEGLGNVTIGMEPADDGSVWYDADCINPGREVHCPYGRVGEHLWVKEKWSLVEGARDETGRDPDAVIYAAGGPQRYFNHYNHTPEGQWDAGEKEDAVMVEVYDRWRSPMFMPRWASRITLEIASVRAERLHDITEADAIAEGCKSGIEPGSSCDLTARGNFKRHWDTINGKKQPWSVNPWVWVLDFVRI